MWWECFSNLNVHTNYLKSSSKYTFGLTGAGAWDSAALTSSQMSTVLQTWAIPRAQGSGSQSVITWPSSTGNTWDLVINARSWPHPTFTDEKLWGWSQQLESWRWFPWELASGLHGHSGASGPHGQREEHTLWTQADLSVRLRHLLLEQILQTWASLGSNQSLKYSLTVRLLRGYMKLSAPFLSRQAAFSLETEPLSHPGNSKY